MKHEYAFDTTMNAVVRIMAGSEMEARKAMATIIDTIDIDRTFFHPFNAKTPAVRITEASLSSDESGPELIEIDGQDPRDFQRARKS